MKFITAIILTALTGFIAGILSFSPWWGFAITSFLVAILVHQKGGKAFLSGFLGIFLLWAGLAWWMDMKNNGILSHKIAQILPLNGNSLLLILITGVVGGLVAGFAAMSGSYLRASSKK
ncbi:MAG TPA: hypothetical protein PLB49_18050 [Chitinophagaceae bacterium]|nr:hypothetical protein [Chitinophagaceae bacterium]HPH33776.1 hypothetical protein [Chitinophagaceae bacterium]